jgi:hypothetical protein
MTVENNILESIAVEQAAGRREGETIKELTDLQLTFVGGGIAEVVPG